MADKSRLDGGRKAKVGKSVDLKSSFDQFYSWSMQDVRLFPPSRQPFINVLVKRPSFNMKRDAFLLTSDMLRPNILRYVVPVLLAS